MRAAIVLALCVASELLLPIGLVSERPVLALAIHTHVEHTVPQWVNPAVSRNRMIQVSAARKPEPCLTFW